MKQRICLDLVRIRKDRAFLSFKSVVKDRKTMCDNRYVKTVFFNILGPAVAHQCPSSDVLHAVEHREKAVFFPVIHYCSPLTLIDLIEAAYRKRICHSGNVIGNIDRKRRVDPGLVFRMVLNEFGKLPDRRRL